MTKMPKDTESQTGTYRRKFCFENLVKSRLKNKNAFSDFTMLSKNLSWSRLRPCKAQSCHTDSPKYEKKQRQLWNSNLSYFFRIDFIMIFCTVLLEKFSDKKYILHIWSSNAFALSLHFLFLLFLFYIIS